MRFADALVTRKSRIEIRDYELRHSNFAKVLPAQIARATVLDATEVYHFLQEHFKKVTELPTLRVIPPWHITFVEMRVQKNGLCAGALVLREDGEIITTIVMGDECRAFQVAVFKCKVDESTGLIVRGSMEAGITPGEEQLAAMYVSVFSAALYAFAFANCKNVNVLTRDLPEKLAKKFEKKNGCKPLRYHVLDIKPLVNRVRTEGGEGSEAFRALHICRGHFRTYTEQRKLFGKVAGTFWFDEHARGNEENGTVVKDYNLPAAA